MKNSVCEKCGFESSFEKKYGVSLCNFCFYFSPEDKIAFEKYISIKVNSSELNSFRDLLSEKRTANQKKGMAQKASSGEVMSRPAFGYDLINGKLIKNPQNSLNVENIFDDFLKEEKPVLSHIAKKYSLSVNGLKKILKNFTYIGKVKFSGQIHDGNHEPIISSTTFNHVQDKLKKLGIK